MYKHFLFIILFPLLSSLEGYTVEQLSTNPRISVLKEFLTPTECDYLTMRAKPYLIPATVTNEKRGRTEVAPIRICTYAFFPANHEDPIVKNIEERLSKAANLPVINCEPLQIVNYQVGGEYKPHYDFFNLDSLGGRVYCRIGGQRVLSLVLYLNTPEAGGETIFPKIDLAVKPVKGDALLFHDIDEFGKEDPLTLHGGAPVLAGEKWIATAWFRAREYRISR